MLDSKPLTLYQMSTNSTRSRLHRVESGVAYQRRGSLVFTDANYRALGEDAMDAKRRVVSYNSAFRKLGSLAFAIPEMNFSYIPTGNQVSIFWDGTNGSRRIRLHRKDDSFFTVPGGSVVITGLAPLTKYYGYPYWSVLDGICDIGWVVGTIGAPRILWSEPSDDAVRLQERQDREPLTYGPLTVETTSGGTGGAESPGGGGDRTNTGRGGRAGLNLE